MSVVTVVNILVLLYFHILESSLTLPLPVPIDSRQDQSSNQEEGPDHRAHQGEGPRETFRGMRRMRRVRLESSPLQQLIHDPHSLHTRPREQSSGS